MAAGLRYTARGYEPLSGVKVPAEGIQIDRRSEPGDQRNVITADGVSRFVERQNRVHLRDVVQGLEDRLARPAQAPDRIRQVPRFNRA